MVLGLLLLGRIDGFAQDGNVSFAPPSPQWNADEPSATFVVRKVAEPTDIQLFSSGEQTPVASSYPPIPIQQPYAHVDHGLNRAVPSNSASRQNLPPGAHSTYSFDSREWAETYPTYPVAGNAGLDSFSSNQVTPSEGNTTPLNAPPYQAPVLHVSNAQPANTVTEQKVASNIRIVDDTVKKEPAPKLDLQPNPKYSKYLKYADVCGVVVVQSNFPLTEIKPLLREIELLQRDLNLYMAVPAPKEKIELCLFRDEASYIRFLKDVYPKAPLDRRALYVKIDKQPGNLLVQRTKDFEIDLRHEMTHAIIHASIPTVPIWLDEGLAKYFEPTPEERATKNPYLKQVRWNVKFGAVPPLNRLERLEFIDEMGTREYRDSWAWVHFLIHHSPQSHRLLAGYLQLLASLPEPEAGKKAKIPPLGLYINDVVNNSKEKYLEHFKTWDVELADDE